MPDNLSYREKLDADRIVQIREISRELPQACGDFLRAIAVTTGTFTRLAYAIDLKTFFHFLQTERVQFSKKPLYASPTSPINRPTPIKEATREPVIRKVGAFLPAT